MSHQATTVLCGEAAGDQIKGGEQILRLRPKGSAKNVFLSIEDLSRAMSTQVSPRFIDLLEIATFVYVADQVVLRGGADAEEMGANWRRRFRFEIPVRCHEFWRSHDVQSALVDLLSFLSEDEYEFSFRPYKAPPVLTDYLAFGKHEGARAPESVVLFSGGLDSLGGVVDEVVVNGRPVVLVTHVATKKLINRFRMLRQMIDQRASGPKPIVARVTVNKEKGMEKEYTQRSRSFLYASLAATVASMCGLREVRFYENGTVSLNLPISRQIVGAKATRTTHPVVLNGFSRLFSLLADERFGVVNGFLWKTKAEVVKGIIDAGCGGMLEWSSSCTHARITTLAKPHCGMCSQCIDRRFAVLGGGGALFERPSSYRVELLCDPRDVGEPRTMLASYVETANQVAAMSEWEFFQRFGEAARVLPAIGGSSDQVARQVYGLYQRHAQGVMQVIDVGIAQHAAEIRARSLPESCLLRLVHDPTVHGVCASPSPEPAPAPPPEDPYFLRQQGGGWLIRYAGHEPQWLKPWIGYVYLRELLRMPAKVFTLAELLVAAHGQRAAIPMGDGGEVADMKTRVACLQRRHEIDEELERATKHNDAAARDRLMSERGLVVAVLHEAGIKKTGKRSNSDLNTARNSVCNALKRALSPIEKYEPDGWQHLRSSLQYGFTLTYDPSEPVPWTF